MRHRDGIKEWLIDNALSREDVDPDRLAMVGLSFGGSSVIRAAGHDDRIKAIILYSAILNLREYLVQAKELQTLARLEGMPGFKVFARLTGSWSERNGDDPEDDPQTCLPRADTQGRGRARLRAPVESGTPGCFQPGPTHFPH